MYSQNRTSTCLLKGKNYNKNSGVSRNGLLKFLNIFAETDVESILFKGKRDNTNWCAG